MYFVETLFSLAETAGFDAGVATDPEGIAYDEVSGNLYLVSGDDDKIYGYTTEGVWLSSFDLDEFEPEPINPQGLTIGPSSDDPEATSFYIVDGLVDNDFDRDAGRGRVYEAKITRYEAP